MGGSRQNRRRPKRLRGVPSSSMLNRIHRSVIQGHKGHHLLTDRSNGKVISISLWETEANMMAGESSGHYQQQLAKFKDLFAAPPVREAYEVSVQP